jgi:hypothetical protein
MADDNEDQQAIIDAFSEMYTELHETSAGLAGDMFARLDEVLKGQGLEPLSAREKLIVSTTMTVLIGYTTISAMQTGQGVIQALSGDDVPEDPENTPKESN